MVDLTSDSLSQGYSFKNIFETMYQALPFSTGVSYLNHKTQKVICLTIFSLLPRIINTQMPQALGLILSWNLR